MCGIDNNIPIHNPKTGSKKEITLQKRQQSTNPDVIFINELARRKRFRKNKKFFTELLEVFNDTSKETKASVRNLKPNDVFRISENPDVGLDHVHKVKKTPKTQKVKKDKTNTIDLNSINTFKIIEDKLDSSHAKTKSNSNLSKSNAGTKEISDILNKHHEDTADFCDSKFESDFIKTNLSEDNVKIPAEMRELIPLQERIECDTLLPPATSPFQVDIEDVYDLQHEESESISNLPISETLPNAPSEPLEERKRKVVWKRKTKDSIAKEKMSELEKQSKEKSFNTTLYSYITLCVSCNFLQRGLATLHYYTYRSKRSEKNPKITDIRIYEVLMRGFAAHGNHNKVNELWRMVSSSGLKLSLEIFAYRLECAGRSTNDRQEISDIIKSLNDTGYNLNDIFVKCSFLGDQRDIILKAIQVKHPNFEPSVPLPSICYSCSLLQELNKKQEEHVGIKSPAEGVISKEEIQELAKEQLNSEFSFRLKVKSIEKKVESEGNLEANREKLNFMRSAWMNDLKKGFDRDVTLLEKMKTSKSISLLPYMKVLDPQSYIEIMMWEVQRLAEGSETFSPTTSQLYRYLGNQVRNRYVIKYKKENGIVDKTKMLYDKYCEWYLNPAINGSRSCNGRQEWQQLLYDHQNGPSIVGDEDYWSSSVLLGIGKFLYNIIVGDVKVDVNILNKTSKQHMLPAFYRVYRQQGVKSVEEIKPHPKISKLFRAASEEHILFDITLVPMLSPPLPWTSCQTGGYLMAKTDIIRLPDHALQQRQRLREAPTDQLYPPLDSLNQLGSIPWRVNKPVLDTVIEVFNNGGSAKLEIPEPSHACQVAQPVNASMTKQERYQAYRQRMLLRRQKAEMYSLWCDALYKLSLANHFRDRVFWLPHNMDFRGRVYPCPPHLNHLGADMSRSLLCFAQGQPLGSTGLDWLKIHLVNLLGTKKRESVKARLEYAETLMSDILDSAEKPLTGRKWWMESETPWQTLACCKEIYAALQHSEGPEHYVSHFPVHQDGSCNGLQHYAALGRDHAGAASVNLLPQDLPQDVYSCVAALVERERAKDSAAGVKVAQELDGFVRRKVIKQTVMTTVYGVTRFGARLQIAKQLKDIDSFPKEYVWPASTYLVLKTFESLREMFNSTKEIQDWFTECARLVSQICGQNMEYVTPLGLPVVQHYSRQLKRPDLNNKQLGHLQDYFPIDMFERPNVMKQKNAFPPNFIHSLDSSHMMLTSIFSEQRGLTFVSVHDCYWTHANTVHIMNQICREQFVALHSQPILEDLSKFMVQKYSSKERLVDQNSVMGQARQRLHSVLTQVPPKGSFVLENVLDSIYFFS
ncbi:DNA-directed RNA polymerase, mitochondrial isoform X2 [Homalodisca vitripennis]|uniref:DNA-directed RNA polymerase, mitochondrial isoform X2 n=1 Tax=Homalodisca vitripennis TaxID=197043 RepID=UPI001EEC6EA3|nr:DNA-directed RNA polymerase, mitochondrial isoform X2 [Homalodisca vitripennis]